MGEPPAIPTEAGSPVPGAMGRLLALMARSVGGERIDRAWIFPPLVKGRKEWGLVALSCFTDDPSRREVITGRFVAELTGEGVSFDPELSVEGLAPPGHLPRVMDGVVRRSDLPSEGPREVEVGGDPARLQVLLREYEIDESPNSS